MQFERIFAAFIVAAAISTGALALRSDAVDFDPALVALPLSATPLPLNRDDPAIDRVGALQFLGAVQIRSSDARFGGLSALRAGKGARLLTVSDTGNWVAFDTIERGGRLVGVANGVMVAIRQPDGRPAATKAAGDAEALEWDPATGDATIVYEQAHRLAHFAGIHAARPATLAAIPVGTEYLTAMTGWPLNGGGEAMAVLAGGAARIIISELARRPDGPHPALLTIGDKTVEIGVDGPKGHAPTDAIALDDHRILVLNRSFSLMGQSAVLTLVDLAPVLAGNATTAPARELARLAPPLTVDNMEGLAIRRSAGRTFVYLLSDDNLNAVQRTILMKFELLP